MSPHGANTGEVTLARVRCLIIANKASMLASVGNKISAIDYLKSVTHPPVAYSEVSTVEVDPYLYSLTGGSIVTM